MTIDDILLKILNECGSSKFLHVKSSAQNAYDLLKTQEGLIRDPAYEVRSKCYRAFQLALETKKSKLISSALSGLHRSLRDDRFQSNFEPEDDSLWLPSQVMHALASISSQSDDTQVEFLKVLLNVACCPYWTVNGRIIIQMLGMCGEVYETGTEAVRTAAQAAANQTLRAFAHLLDVESLEAKDSKMHEVGSGGIDCFNELIPILQYICSRLDETQGGETLLLLEGLLTVVSCVPQRIHTNAHFVKFLWQKLCPVLIGLMEPPKPPQLALPRTLLHQDYLLQQQKILYSIAGQLVRVVGCVGSLRPVLESVYHRMLLYPPSGSRLDAIKALTELMKSPNRLVDFAGPLLVEDEKSCQQSDMALTRLVMDALEECSRSKDSTTLQATVTCVATLLATLLNITTGESINDVYVARINMLYPTLTSSDYSGPLTYQTLCRLPKVYREQVVDDTRQERGDADGNSTDSSTDSDLDYSQSDEGDLNAKVGFPETLDSLKNQKIYSKESGDCERDNARHFVNTLVDYLPTLFQYRTSIEVDQALQSFASNYCQGIYYKSCRHRDIEQAIVNADGIYLATYAALSLNLKLLMQGYYGEGSYNIPITEEEFVSQVEGSGVLVYLSSRWLCEVYQQVLSRDLLTTAGSRKSMQIVSLLTDLGGIDDDTELLSECAKLERAYSRHQTTPEIQAGLKLSRRVLTCCWDSVLTVLTAGAKADKITLPISLEALHNAALLCNLTGLEGRSGSVFSLLSGACCTTTGDKPNLIASHALSLDIMIQGALVVASHAPQSWPHILKCCLHVNHLENMLIPVVKNKSSDYDIQEASVPVPEKDIQTLVGELTGTAPLPQSTAASVICILSHNIDRMFEDAGVKLKLSALLSFASAVCSGSERQLRVEPKSPRSKMSRWWQNQNGGKSHQPLLLTRLANLLIRATRSGRPLIHVMKLWSIIGPHLMHSACHKDGIIAKLAVTCIHDVMMTLFNEHAELPHFHFNEALFKPFENLLCLELCDTDVQDQVVNCMCEFVEGCQGEIRSGWRPLFRSLGGVATHTHIHSLLEVFSVFLATDNPQVLANAAPDFIHCLVKHIKGNGGDVTEAECKDILEIAQRTSQILCSLHLMPSTPAFNTPRRLEEDLGNGALAVWAELIEGLASAVHIASNPSHQPLLLNCLFSILSEILNKPGVEFAIFCISHIVLASLERWLNANSEDVCAWDRDAPSFKHYAGLTTHLVVKLLAHPSQVEKRSDKVRNMIERLVSFNVDCTSVPVESIARLGCACLRHIVVRGWESLNTEEWTIVCSGVARAAREALQPLNVLVSAYSPNCHQYYGDQGHIKVAARRDNVNTTRMTALAQQVLLLESQRWGNQETSTQDERSYVMLLYEDQNASASQDSVPLHTLLVSLLSHQMLLQTIGTILLQGTHLDIPSIAGVISERSCGRALDKLSSSSVDVLLACLELSYSTAVDFDTRPGLKFLVQKVAGLERAANLYRQAGAAWTIGLIALFDLLQRKQGFLDKLKTSLETLCKTYIDILVDKEGAHSAVDSLHANISFIVAVTDDLPEGTDAAESPETPHEGTDTSSSSDEEEAEGGEQIKAPHEITRDGLVAEIERQKRDSIAKDREAHMAVWAEMLVSALELLCQLDSEALAPLLPAVFPTLESLTAHAAHASLKAQLARLYHRLGLIYGFTSTKQQEAPE